MQDSGIQKTTGEDDDQCEHSCPNQGRKGQRGCPCDVMKGKKESAQPDAHHSYLDLSVVDVDLFSQRRGVLKTPSCAPCANPYIFEKRFNVRRGNSRLQECPEARR